MHLILTILIIHIIVSYDQKISLIFYVKMDSMSDCDIRLVFTFPPKDSTLQYKKCVLHWNNFPCISTLDKIQHLYISIFSLPLIRQTKSFLFCLSHGKLTVLFCLWHGKLTVLFCLWQGKLNVLFFGSHGFLNSEPSEINIIFCKINRKLGR